MQFPSLIEGRLIKRYKRFLADVELSSGEVVTAHCPNTGSMTGCCDPGSRVWLLDSKNPKRKLPLTWELVEVQSKFIACVNTGRANAIVKEGIEQGVVAELQGYEEILSEKRYGNENSRIDLLLRRSGQPDCYVEVKNVTLLGEGGNGSFPDAVTSRGTKHLRELMDVVAGGNRAVLFYNVAHTGIERVSPAWDIDPEYASTLAEAIDHGVEVLTYQVALSPKEIRSARSIHFTLGR